MSNSTAVATRPDTAPLSLSQVEHDIIVKQASLLARSTIVPKVYQDQPANCLVALEYAHRLRCSALAVMQNLDIIEGKPGLRATFLIGTVNASGRFSPIRFKWQGTPDDGDQWGCRAVAVDLASGEECTGPLITIGLAKAEGWYQKKGSKWQTIPELMLSYRAGAWWTRIYCPDLALGLHTTDEIEDVYHSSPRGRAESVSAALAATDDSPVQDAEVVTEVEPTSDEKQASLKRLQEMYDGMLRQRGWDDSDEDAFEKRLVEENKVSTLKHTEWTAQDYRSAIAELDRLPVDDGGES